MADFVRIVRWIHIYVRFRLRLLRKRGLGMEELLCTIEIYKQWGDCVGKVASSVGGKREYKDKKFMEVLDQIIMDVKEEFEAGSG